MTRTRALFAVSFGVALAAACGGSTSNKASPDGGGTGTTSGGGTLEDGSSSSGASSSGGAPSDGGIPCGMTTCAAPQVCCVSMGEGGFNLTESCADSCPDGGSQIACTSPAQCQSSEVCCGTFGGRSFNASCTAGPCPAMGFELCASQADCSGGATCGGMAGFMICYTPRDGGYNFDGSFSRDGGFPMGEAGPAEGGGTSGDGAAE